MTSFAQVIGEPDAFRPAVTMSAEFAEIWLDEVTRLYLLAFLLTAEKAFAEECFAGAMDDYVRSPAAVASAWARGPGRIGVIRRAVHLIRPLPKSVHSRSRRSLRLARSSDSCWFSPSSKATRRKNAPVCWSATRQTYDAAGIWPTG